MKEKILFIGAISYDDATRLQSEERMLIKNGKSSGAIFFLEHFPPVITAGREGILKNLLQPKEYLDSRGIEIKTSSRGGDLTAHEPGQLVVYFVLPVDAKNAGKFINNIIEKIILCLEKDFGIISSFDKNNPGLWSGGEKICSLGFDLTSRVSMHGIAINVCNSLETFQYIVPCGINAKMTTMEKVTGRKISIEDVYSKLKIFFE